MTEANDTSSPEPDEPRITVRGLAGCKGIRSRRIIDAVRAALDGRSVRAVHVAVVDDAEIAGLHGRYLDDPTATDVLTFDLRDDPSSIQIEGDIVVSGETARREAAQRRLEAGEELLRYVVHGALHLCGMTDDTAAGRAQMRKAEDRVLAALESPRRRARRNGKR